MPRVRIKSNKMDTTIEQACDQANWRWKRWDIRADGKVFWCYFPKRKNNEYWVSWDSILKLKKSVRLGQLKYRNNLGDGLSQKQKLWRDQHKNKIAAYKKSPKYRLYLKKHKKDRTKNDPVFAMSMRARRRIRMAIKRIGGNKKSPAQDMLGCSWDEFKRHLELKFVNGMSWDNRSLWHIDHIIPLASAKSIEEVVKLCHYTNLQPLWAKDNLNKGAKILT